MASSYLLSEAAQQDVISIRNYTTDTWGKAQNDKYLSLLQQRLEWLANNPALGKQRNEINEGYLTRIIHKYCRALACSFARNEFLKERP